MKKKTAIIIGAGPAGLTAAYELLTRTDIMPIVLEKSDFMGGISRTINYKGNRIDIGGHRFFSKSDRVMQWWLTMIPIEATHDDQKIISYQGKKSLLTIKQQGPDPEKEDKVMLIRRRKSRIYYNRTFFDYPVKLNIDTLSKLGLIKTLRIGASYGKSLLFPIKNEKNLEQFFINRFGQELYETFFKSYTHKVWGVPCHEISAEWGAQRVKGVSILKSIEHFFKTLFVRSSDIAQKNTETSLIEQFLYPKYGPGHMWQEVAKKITALGGVIKTKCTVTKLSVDGNHIRNVTAFNHETGKEESFEADYVFSTMPVKELINDLQTEVPRDIKHISDGLQYRDFITVGLLLNRLKVKEHSAQGQQLITDNWIYIQEHDVQVGRLQIFNNWSPYMVADRTKVWVGLEYFCYDTDDLWKKADDQLIALAQDELEKIAIIEKSEVLDATVIRMEKTYPAYFGTYNKFDQVQKYLDQFENLFLVGRNGMHKYNNQDHSMLTAMTAVDNIIAGIIDKTNIWSVNTEQEYHESKK